MAQPSRWTCCTGQPQQETGIRTFGGEGINGRKEEGTELLYCPDRSTGRNYTLALWKVVLLLAGQGITCLIAGYFLAIAVQGHAAQQTAQVATTHRDAGVRNYSKSTSSTTRTIPEQWKDFLDSKWQTTTISPPPMASATTANIIELHKKLADVEKDNRLVHGANERLWSELKAKTLGRTPYLVMTGTVGHQAPAMYGKVKEKTIWSYWHHPVHCPGSYNCTLPPHVQLCVEVAARNRGGFDHKVMHMDEVSRYLNALELPLQWRQLKPQHQKDAIMNALLGRYGGVALDITVLLLRPLDIYWEEMVRVGATFRGYMYRLNGQAHRHAEATAVWFLMSRKDGLFSVSTRNQVQGMGDATTTKGLYKEPYFALGDQTLTPILTSANYNLPKCYEDSTVIGGAAACPEFAGPPWYRGLTGPARNDAKLMLSDPRDGPVLPFALMPGMAMWSVLDTRKPLPHWDVRWPSPYILGGPMYGEQCDSMKACWDNVFFKRFHQPHPPDVAPLLSFVKFFGAGHDLSGYSRQALLAKEDTYFYQWLKLAGHPCK